MNHRDNLNATLPEEIAALAKHPNMTIADIFSVPRHPIMYTRTGYILRVYITNFLTHRDKVIDFECPVSLIHGPNGAGKSSILQAIHFVLGGKAKNIRDNCDKFSNLKTVVCLKDTNSNVQISHCSVIAYFYHQGSSEFPGPIIALKRTITNEVANFFLCTQFPSNAKSSLKFERISLEKAHSILISMGHFPDNEITMVSQSRMKVLVRMKPVDRYKIFSAAVSFDEIESRLTKSQVSLENSIKDSMKISKYLKDLGHEMKRIAKKIQAMKEYHETDIELNKAGLRQIALYIQRQRVYVQNHRIDLEQAEIQELAQLSAEYTRKENAKANTEPYLKRYNTEIDELSARLEEDKKRLMDLFEDITMQKGEQEQIEKHINSLEKELKVSYENVSLLKKHITEHNNILNNATYAHNQFDLPEKNEEHKKSEEEHVSLQSKLIQLQGEKRALENALLNVSKQKDYRITSERADQQERDNALDQLNHLQRKLELELSGSTTLEKCISSLQPQNKSIYARVNAETFSDEVVAPLAAYVWVKALPAPAPSSLSSELAAIIGRVIGSSLLNTIAYRDKKDEQKLRNVLGRSIQLVNLLRPTIPTMHEYNRLIQELDAKYHGKVISVIQCLGSSSPLALEVLQLKIKLSTLVICDNIEIAHAVLEIGKKVRISYQCLPRDRECLLFNGNNNSIIMRPAYNNFGSTKYQSLYLATDNISDLQKEIQNQQEIYEKAKAKLEHNFSTEKISIMEAQEALKMNEIQTKIDSVSAEIATVVQTLENNNRTLFQLQQQYAQTIEQYNLHKKAMEKETKKYEHSRTIVDSSKSKLTVLEAKIEVLEDDLKKSTILLKDKQDVLHQQESVYKKCDSDVITLENDIAEKIDQRNSIQAENLDQQIKQIEMEISACKAKIKTLKDFLDSAQESVLNELRTFLEVFENLSSLSPDYKERQNKLIYDHLKDQATYNSLNNSEKTLDGTEHTQSQGNSPSFMELYHKVLTNKDSTTRYCNSITYVAFLLVDFVATYSIYADGQDSKCEGSVPNTSHGTNKQLITAINNLLTDVSKDIQQIDEKKQRLAQEFNGDIEHERQSLLQMESTIQGLKKHHKTLKTDIVTIGELAVQQIIMLISIRSRTEHEISFHFQQTSKITGIDQRLYFHFPELPIVSHALLERIDEKIADKYNEICSTQLHASWGIEPSNKLASSTGESPNDAKQNLITTVVSSRGSIDIRSKTRGVTSLSGGESTFTSLCFMLSCWLVIRTRYAQIDEWDVFMDATRRKKAFKLMMDAILQTSVQVVLVTPSDVDISDLDDATKKLIGIIKLLSTRN